MLSAWAGMFSTIWKRYHSHRQILRSIVWVWETNSVCPSQQKEAVMCVCVYVQARYLHLEKNK